jgi:hypothetical protein
MVFLSLWGPLYVSSKMMCVTCSRDGWCQFHKDFPDLVKTLRENVEDLECWSPKDVIRIWDDKRIG